MEGGKEGGEGVMEGGMVENYYCRAEKFLFHFVAVPCVILRTFCIFNDLAAILLPFRCSWVWSYSLVIAGSVTQMIFTAYTKQRITLHYEHHHISSMSTC